MKKMNKSLLLLSVFVVILSGCSNIAVYKIGEMTMASNKNIDSNAEYVLLRSYMGASEKEIKKSENRSLDAAIDDTVKNTPGSEFLKNVKFYMVLNKGNRFYVSEGDVWGVNHEHFRGFKIGDKVQWKTMFSKKTGVITNFKDATECTMKIDDSEDYETIEYEELLKIGTKTNE